MIFWGFRYVRFIKTIKTSPHTWFSVVSMLNNYVFLVLAQICLNMEIRSQTPEFKYFWYSGDSGIQICPMFIKTIKTSPHTWFSVVSMLNNYVFLVLAQICLNMEIRSQTPEFKYFWYSGDSDMSGLSRRLKRALIHDFLLCQCWIIMFFLFWPKYA